MVTVICPHTQTLQTLGPHQRISAHRSRAGVVTYYRCGCGELVVDEPKGRRHSHRDLRPAV